MIEEKASNFLYRATPSKTLNIRISLVVVASAFFQVIQYIAQLYLWSYCVVGTVNVIKILKYIKVLAFLSYSRINWTQSSLEITVVKLIWYPELTDFLVSGRHLPLSSGRSEQSTFVQLMFQAIDVKLRSLFNNFVVHWAIKILPQPFIP